MAERVYTTDGLVLSKWSLGESSVSASLLTEHYGLVSVRAQSAREGTGKLRYVLEPFTIGSFSFVRGKRGARIIGGVAYESAAQGLSGKKRNVLGNVSRLLLRLLPGEEPHPFLCKLVIQGFRYLKEASEERREAIECALILTVLKELGYVSNDITLLPFTQSPFNETILAEFSNKRVPVIRAINQALRESGL